MRRVLIGLLVLIALGGAGFWWLTRPRVLPAEAVAAENAGDASRGEVVFWAGGCVSCHAAKGAEGDARLRLGGGGEPLETKFGTFHAPNISPDPNSGIGRWSLADFANAMQRGIAPDGAHLYPAFPYTSYARMTKEDVADLFAYLKTLPAVAETAPANEVPFPFNIRRGLGLWQLAFLDPAPVATLAADASAEVRRGQYLVEGPGHCGECHTPRRLGGAGGLDYARWLKGAPNPEGQGTIPDISPSGLDWSKDELVEYFTTGFTPDFDAVGGQMAEVQKNLAELPPSDREAIAAYLKALPAG